MSKTGIIYKIVCNDLEIKECYVGSTINFRSRKHDHKKRCNNPNSDKYNINVYKFIRDNKGWDNWDMIQIEEYKFNNRRELNARKRYWIETLNAKLNVIIPTRTNKEYYEQHKEQIRKKAKDYAKNNPELIKEQSKKYRTNNKEKIKEKDKKYYENNKEKIKQKNTEYFENNKDQIRERDKIRSKIKRDKNKDKKIICECGKLIGYNSRFHHRRIKQHKFYQEVYDYIYS